MRHGTKTVTIKVTCKLDEKHFNYWQPGKEAQYPEARAFWDAEAAAGRPMPLCDLNGEMGSCCLNCRFQVAYGETNDYVREER